VTYRSPVPLQPQHQLEEFSCGSEEQTHWLRRHARQSAASGSTRVFVVTETDSDQVVVYYAWCMAQLTLGSAPERVRRGAGRYPQPVALLARLGVDSRHEGRGLGAGLLKDVLLRFAAVADEIGTRALLVHAESDTARDYYLHLLPDFLLSPTDPLHLVLLAKDLRRTLRP
jgi:GNAT superfamily N-acetyltransferase